MDMLRKFPLAGLVAGSLLLTAGCAYNKSNTAPSPQPAPRPAVTAPQTSNPTVATVTPTPKPVPAPAVTTTAKPETKPRVVHKPSTPTKPHVTKTAALKAAPKPEPKKPATPILQKATPEPVQPAIAQKISIPPAPQPVETVHVALDKLPIRIHDQWVVDLSHSQCLLKSKPVKMEDGQGGTTVTFQLTPDSLEFLTKSDIDTSYKGTGVQIDDGQTFPLETVAKVTNLTFTRQRKTLLNDMENGHTLQLTLGFWPTWPVTHTYSVTLPLDHFGTAVHAWETCNQLLKSK